MTELTWDPEEFQTFLDRCERHGSCCGKRILRKSRGCFAVSEYSPWKVQVVRFWGEGWRWKLVNRRGETVMLSHNHPTEAGARASAEVEWDSLRSAVFIK